MHCPYCGQLFEKEDLLTEDQMAYIRQMVNREVTPVIVDEFNKMIRRTIKGSHWSFKPAPHRPSPPVPEPSVEPSADSQLQCPDCSVRFQVDGIFGYCPGCRSENMLLYDANLALIRKELTATGEPYRQLRHAYGDLVSTFEIFCRKEARRLGITHARMQNLEVARDTFRDAKVTDILASLAPNEDLDLRRAFQKRHVSEHNDGVADERYVKNVPEDSHLFSKKVELSADELERAATALRKVIAALVNAR